LSSYPLSLHDALPIILRTVALAGIAGVALPAVGMAQEETYRVYVANEFSADVSVIDSASQEVVETITISDRAGEVRPRGMAVSPDGSNVYISVSDFK